MGGVNMVNISLIAIIVSVIALAYAGYLSFRILRLSSGSPKMQEIAKAAGAAETIEMDMSEHYGAPETKHLLGTTRMGDDPAQAVCDKWGRLHEVNNVWIADGALWPTSAAFNPVLTQQALAYRTAAFMVHPTDPLSVIKNVK